MLLVHLRAITDTHKRDLRADDDGRKGIAKQVASMAFVKDAALLPSGVVLIPSAAALDWPSASTSIAAARVSGGSRLTRPGPRTPRPRADAGECVGGAFGAVPRQTSAAPST